MGSPPPATKAFAAAALLALLCAAAPIGGPPAASGETVKPNLVLIVTDDQTLGDLYARAKGGKRGARIMPQTLGLIRGGGVTFRRAYASNPISCPSRASILTGQYSFNHGIYANIFPNGGPCSEPGRIDLGKSLPVWLRAAGYTTLHYGRFLNAWGTKEKKLVAPGWDRWVTAVDSSTPAALYYGYHLNEDGAISARYGHPLRRDPDNYFTDVITTKALADLYQPGVSRPFFVTIDHRAPHEDLVQPVGPEPALRYAKSLRGKRLPVSPSFNERNTRDKAPFLRDSRRLSRRQVRAITWRNRRRLQSLRAVDDSVASLLASLQRAGELDQTYVIFMSDHGFFNGEHRITKGKRRPYEPAARIPLLIRGPGIPAGRVSPELVSNVDIAPTILELAGASADRNLDGRSLLRFARSPRSRTRRPLLLESYFGRFGNGDYVPIGTVGANAAGDPTPQTWRGIVAGKWKLIRFGKRTFELYNLRRDPHELHSLARRPRYRNVLRFLKRRLRRLGRCRGAACRASIPKPPRPRKPRGKRRKR